MQSKLDDVSAWTKENLMKLNESKSKYIIFSRSKQEFNTRLQLNEQAIERIPAIKVLGVWIEEDMKWDLNTKQICKKSFTRIQMLSKLKYAGIKKDDLLTIYKLFIRSIAEYCSAVFHTSLTAQQTKKIEVIQKTSLKIILGHEYTDYETACIDCNLETLAQRREKRLLKFTIKCLDNPANSVIPPKMQKVLVVKFSK